MEIRDPLGEELIRLARRLKDHDIKIIVGGGYGLLLKANYLITKGENTRIVPVPMARATNDLDLFLHAEIITSRKHCETLREVLDEDYEPIESAKYYQFLRKDSQEQIGKPIKIDLLASPPEAADLRQLISMDSRRVRPQGQAGVLHARRSDEAVFVEEYAVRIGLNDEHGSVDVFLPHPFAYLLLKLNALNDRKDDALKGTYHAFDVYRIIAMMTESEWNESERLTKHLSDHKQFQRASGIVRSLFADESSRGVVLIRRFAQENNQQDPDISALTQDLADLFS